MNNTIGGAVPEARGGADSRGRELGNSQGKAICLFTSLDNLDHDGDVMHGVAGRCGIYIIRIYSFMSPSIGFGTVTCCCVFVCSPAVTIQGI